MGTVILGNKTVRALGFCKSQGSPLQKEHTGWSESREQTRVPLMQGVCNEVTGRHRFSTIKKKVWRSGVQVGIRDLPRKKIEI